MFQTGIVGEIRLLPTDKRVELQSQEAVRRFVAEELPAEGWRYYYQSRGIRVRNRRALILLQHDGAAVAYGLLKKVKRLAPADWITQLVHGRRVTYRGYYEFYPGTVHNIAPIYASELRRIDGGFSCFCQSKQFLDMAGYVPLCRLLERRRRAWEASPSVRLDRSRDMPV